MGQGFSEPVITQEIIDKKLQYNDKILNLGKDEMISSQLIKDKKMIVELSSSFNHILEKNNLNLKNKNFLEVFAGNGYFKQYYIENYPLKMNWYLTDKNEFENVKQEDSVSAVQNFNNKIDVLLMSRPPPGTLYQDILAIWEYEKKEQNNDKYLIFCGEIGHADGSEGLDTTLGLVSSQPNPNNKWDLIDSKDFFNGAIDIMGNDIKRKVYLFKHKP